MNRPSRSILMKFGAVPLALALTVSAGIGVAVSAAVTPPTVSTGHIASTLPTSAVATGTINPNGAATSWYFEYGLSASGGFASKTPTTNAGSGTTDTKVTGTMTGLAPATSYSYRIVATNSGGTTKGGVGIFNTTAAPAVITGAASYVTAATATINGIVNPEALATSWYFEYGLTTHYGSTTPTKQMASNLGDTAISAGISGLNARTVYHFRVVAKSSAGTSLGADFMFTTGLSVTLNSSAPKVIYGDFVTLSGALSSGKSGVQVTIMSKPFNHAAASSIAAVTTANNGTWSYSAQPTVRTTFSASADGGSSSPVVISVAPRVYLNKVSGGRLSTRVVGSVSFASHVLQLQRFSHGLWVTWKHVRLNNSAKAVFTTSLPVGVTSIRMAIGPFVPGIDQAAPGYVAGYSRTLAYRR